jgi:hypothetical protein
VDTPFAGYALAKSPVEERRHLPSGHIPRRAIPVISRWVASLRHASRPQTVDVVLEDRIIIIEKQVPTAVVGVPQRPHKERSHLLPRYLAIRTKAIVLAPWAALAIPPIRVPVSSISTRLAGAVVALVALTAVFPLALLPLGVLDDEVFPAPNIQEAIRGLDLFHDAAVGGFLMYAEWPDRLVYFDDRAELYGASRLVEFGEARDGFYEEEFARYGFSAALTRSEWTLTDVLTADGWRVVTEDETFTVFVSD